MSPEKMAGATSGFNPWMALRAIPLRISRRNKFGHFACLRMERGSEFCAVTSTAMWFCCKSRSDRRLPDFLAAHYIFSFPMPAKKAAHTLATAAEPSLFAGFLSRLPDLFVVDLARVSVQRAGAELGHRGCPDAARQIPVRSLALSQGRLSRGLRER